MSAAEDQRHTHVSLSHYYPVAGIPHAGGEYVRRHLLAVSQMSDVSAFVSSDHAPAGRSDRAAIDVTVVERPRWGRSLPARALRLCGRRWNPASVGFDVRWSFRRSDALRAAVASADTVEFQFFEECWAVDLAREWNPSARMIAVVHDVISQRLERQLNQLSRSSPARWLLAARLAAMRRQERRILGKFDVVTVFSDKDRWILREIGVQSAVHVLHLPLVDDEQIEEARHPEEGNVLFIGAFDRVENSDAAMWLLDEIWPQVVGRHPSATLTLAGANPTTAMQEAASRHAAVRITGYLDDLAEVYKSASVVAVPLRRGAGVKFKTVVALLWGIPLVSTTVGMEGIPTSGDFALLADDAEGFAEKINRALAGDADSSAASGQEWARSYYSQDAFDRDLKLVLGLA